MHRYFIELSYKGTAYSGFQIQQNAITVQSVVEEAFAILHRYRVEMTGSSRTDAGVHAFQNYFHFDTEAAVHEQFVYKMNALLPRDIAIRAITELKPEAHSRFDAIGRLYRYQIHRRKEPFLNETSLYYPYKINENLLFRASELFLGEHDFSAFSKTNTQVKNKVCLVRKSEWNVGEWTLSYEVEGNRFLRGMVRLMVGAMLKVARGRLDLDGLGEMIAGRGKAGVSVGSEGLSLMAVRYPENYFSLMGVGLSGLQKI